MTGWKPIPLVVIAIVFIVSCVWIVRDGGGQYLLNTLLLGLATSAISIPLGAWAAWATFTGRGFFRGSLVLITIAAALIPFYLQVNAWDSLIGRLSWLLTAQNTTLTPILDGWSATIWIHAMAATPWVALMFMMRMVVDDSVGEEQALLDTGTLTVFFRISFRKYLPITIVALLWNVTMASREIAATNIYKVRTLAEDIYLRFSLGQFDPFEQRIKLMEPGAFNPGAVNPWISIVVQVACLSSFVFAGIWIGWNAFPWSRLSQRLAICSRTSKFNLWRWIAYVTFPLLVVAGPLVSMIIRAGIGVERVDDQAVANYSFERLLNIVGKTPSEYFNEYCWTFAIGAISASLVTISAVTCAGFARRSRLTRYLSTFSAAVFVSIPGPIIGLVLLLLANEFEAIRWLSIRTAALPVVAVSVIAWPWAFFLSSVIWQRIGQDELDAIALETSGIRWFFTQFNLRSAMVFAVVWLVAFALAIGDLAASYFVMPAGVDTLARRTFGLLHSGVSNETAALGICNFLLVLIVASVLYLLGRKAFAR